MKHRRKATICAVLMGIFLTGISYGANANEAGQAELSEIIDGESYIKINFGGGYIGKSAEYDILHRRTVVQPNDRENRTIIRSRNMLTVFYGKYRGKDEYKDYHEIFPELDADFFLSPMKKLRLTVSEIQENDYTIQITDKQQIENFLIPLSYIGALDNEIFVIESVEILFDEGCRPIEVRFALGSETAEPERTVYQENQLKQTYEYIEESVFEEHYSEIEREIDEIVPLEDVEIIDYIDELSNVVKIADEHFLLVLRGRQKNLKKCLAGIKQHCLRIWKL